MADRWVRGGGGRRETRDVEGGAWEGAGGRGGERHEGRAEPADPAAAARQRRLAADLLAACSAAGAGPVIAAQAGGEGLDGPVGEALARGAAEVRLGGEPAQAWRRLAELPGAGA